MNATIAINDGDTHNGPSRAGRGEIPAAGGALCAAPGFRRRRTISRRARHRAGGAGAPRHPLQLADRPREMPALGPRSAAFRAAATASRSHRFGETRSSASQRQGVQPGAAIRRCLYPAFRRRRRLRLRSIASSDALERDVRCGYVSREAARRLRRGFRPGTGKIDVAASRGAAGPMRREGLPHDKPVAGTAHAACPAGARACAPSRAREADRGGAVRGGDRKAFSVGWAYRPRNGSGAPRASCGSRGGWCRDRARVRIRSWQSAAIASASCIILSRLKCLVAQAHALPDDLQQCSGS